MADELKTRSFRISEDTADRFKQLCASFGNQNSALDALIATYEMQQADGNHGKADRCKRF